MQARSVVANAVSASHRPAGATSRWMRRSDALPAYLIALSTRFDEDLIDHGDVHAHVRLNIRRARRRAPCRPARARAASRGDQPVEQLSGRDDLAAVGGAAALQPGKGQNVLDQMAEPVGLGANRFQVRPLRFGAPRPSPRRASRCRDETSSVACEARASRPRRKSPGARSRPAHREAPARPPRRQARGTPRRSRARAGPATSSGSGSSGAEPASSRTGSEASIRVGLDCRRGVDTGSRLRAEAGRRQLHQVASDDVPVEPAPLQKSPLVDPHPPRQKQRAADPDRLERPLAAPSIAPRAAAPRPELRSGPASSFASASCIHSSFSIATRAVGQRGLVIGLAASDPRQRARRPGPCG